MLWLAVEGVARSEGPGGSTVLHLEGLKCRPSFAAIVRAPVPDDSGVAHALEHLVGTASERYPQPHVFRRLLDSGHLSFLNGFTTPDLTVYVVEAVSAAGLRAAIDRVLAGLAAPCSTAQQFEREVLRRVPRAGRQALAGAMAVEVAGLQGSAAYWHEWAVTHALYGDGAHGRHYAGELGALAGLSVARVREFHQRHYHASNFVLVSAGLGAQAQLDDALACWQPPCGSESAQLDVELACERGPVRVGVPVPGDARSYLACDLGVVRSSAVADAWTLLRALTHDRRWAAIERASGGTLPRLQTLPRRSRHTVILDTTRATSARPLEAFVLAAKRMLAAHGRERLDTLRLDALLTADSSGCAIMQQHFAALAGGEQLASPCVDELLEHAHAQLDALAGASSLHVQIEHEAAGARGQLELAEAGACWSGPSMSVALGLPPLRLTSAQRRRVCEPAVLEGLQRCESAWSIDAVPAQSLAWLGVIMQAWRAGVGFVHAAARTQVSLDAQVQPRSSSAWLRVRGWSLAGSECGAPSWRRLSQAELHGSMRGHVERLRAQLDARPARAAARLAIAAVSEAGAVLEHARGLTSLRTLEAAVAAHAWEPLLEQVDATLAQLRSGAGRGRLDALPSVTDRWPRARPCRLAVALAWPGPCLHDADAAAFAVVAELIERQLFGQLRARGVAYGLACRYQPRLAACVVEIEGLSDTKLAAQLLCNVAGRLELDTARLQPCRDRALARMAEALRFRLYASSELELHLLERIPALESNDLRAAIDRWLTRAPRWAVVGHERELERSFDAITTAALAAGS